MKFTWLPLRGCFSLALFSPHACHGAVYRAGALRGILGARGWNTTPPTVPAHFRRRCDAKRALEAHAVGMVPHDQRDPWTPPRRAVWRVDGTRYCCNESVAKDEQRRCRAAIRRARHRGGRAAARAGLVRRVRRSAA